MAAINVYANKPAAAGTVLATTLQQLVPAPEVAYIDYVCDAASYVVIDNAGADGGAITGLARFMVPANTVYPIPCQNHGCKVFVAAVTGTPNGYFLGVDRG